MYPRYTFYSTCSESHHQLKLNDGSCRIFLNTKATELSGLDAELEAFYHYIQKGEAESDLTKVISNKIHTLKSDSIERSAYMTLALTIADIQYDAYEEGFEEGIEKGIEKGIEQGAYQKALETAKVFLSMGLSLEQVVQGTGLPLETVEKLAKPTWF